MFKRKKIINSIQKKHERLDELHNQSNGAIALITDTIEDLEQTNAEIEQEVAEIGEMLDELALINEALNKRKAINNKIANKFKDFICVDDEDGEGYCDECVSDEVEQSPEETNCESVGDV